MIKRKITYSEVIVTYGGADSGYAYLVYGETTPIREMRKILKENKGGEIPRITVITVTETRAISLDDFIKNSISISEGDDLNEF